MNRGRSVTKVDYATTFRGSCWRPAFMGVCCCVLFCRKKIYSMVTAPATVKVTTDLLSPFYSSFLPLYTRDYSNHVSNVSILSFFLCFLHRKSIFLSFQYTLFFSSSLSFLNFGGHVFFFFFVIPSGFLVSPRVFYYRHGKDLGKVQGLGGLT